MTDLFILAQLAELVLAFLSGRARGHHHMKRDYPHASAETPTTMASPDEYAYYWGLGTWNQSWPHTADYTHHHINMQVIYLALARTVGALTSILAFLAFSWWALPIALLQGALIWWIEGRGFTLWYHVLLPAPPRAGIDYSVWQWFKDWVTWP